MMVLMKTDKRAAKRQKARYGMKTTGKSVKLHHELSVRRAKRESHN